MNILTRSEFLRHPDKWRDIDHVAVIELKKFCYEYIKKDKRLHRDWFDKFQLSTKYLESFEPERRAMLNKLQDEMEIKGGQWDAHFLKQSIEVLEK